MIFLKQFVLFIFLTATGLANANLVEQNLIAQNKAQHNFALPAHQDIQYSGINQKVQTLLANSYTVHHFMDSKHSLSTNKMAAIKSNLMYSKLFDYVSHVDAITENEGLTAFWKGTIISNANDAVIAQKHQNDVALLAVNMRNMTEIAADSLNDQYTNEVEAVNEVPLPAAAWLFTSAIILFGFARRNNI